MAEDEKNTGNSNKTRQVDGLSFDYSKKDDQIEKSQSSKGNKIDQIDTTSKKNKVDRALEKKKNDFFEERQPSFLENYINRFKKTFSLLVKKLSFGNLIKLVVLAFFITGGLSLYLQAGEIQGEVKGAAYSGKDYLTKAREAADEFDIVAASKNFGLASDEIGLASQALIEKGQYNIYWYQLPYNKDSTSSLIGSVILIDQTISELDGIYSNFLELLDSGDFSQKRQEVIYKKLDFIENNLSLLSKKIYALSDDQNFFPSQVDSIRNDILLIEDQIVLIKDFVKKSPDFLGFNQEKKYLLLFQNNSEPRPTGGFIGTFGYLTLDEGKIDDLYIDEIYGPRDKLRDTKLDQIKETSLGYPENIPKELIPAKEILEEYRHAFYAHNTNCTTDFPTSARRALWSFENVLEQPHAQDVISITPNVIEEILDIVGPIEFDDYDVVLSADNFRDVVQYKVEVDNPFKQVGEEDYNPKQIIVDFTPLLFERIASSSLEEKIKIFTSILDMAQDKHILLFSQDFENESFINKYQLGGEVTQRDADYLQIVLDAQNATKSGLHLEKDYFLETSISQEGKVKHGLEIKLKNDAQGNLYYYSGIKLLVRVMVPYGSQLEEFSIENIDKKSEVKIINESGKLNYLFDLELEPDEEKKIELSYFSSYLAASDNSYLLNYQTQPGSILTDFDWQFELSKNNQIIEYYPKQLKFVDHSTINLEQEDIKRDLEFKLDFMY